MMHVFWFTEIEYMLFFTGQQETEQCSLPLVQQVNMLGELYLGTRLDNHEPCKMLNIKCQVFEYRPSEVIPVVLCVAS